VFAYSLSSLAKLDTYFKSYGIDNQLEVIQTCHHTYCDCVQVPFVWLQWSKLDEDLQLVQKQVLELCLMAWKVVISSCKEKVVRPNKNLGLWIQNLDFGHTSYIYLKRQIIYRSG